jgi:hypothetical protein
MLAAEERRSIGGYARGDQGNFVVFLSPICLVTELQVLKGRWGVHWRTLWRVLGPGEALEV